MPLASRAPPCYATGPTLGRSAPIQRTCFILSNMRSDNKSRMREGLSPVKLILSFPHVILQENKVKQILFAESMAYRKVCLAAYVNLQLPKNCFVSQQNAFFIILVFLGASTTGIQNGYMLSKI